MYVKRANDNFIRWFNANRNELTGLAQAWLEMGNRAVGIWGQQLLACWPASTWDELSKLQEPDMTLCASIKVEDIVVGRIGVLGVLQNLTRKARLDAETSLISQLLTMQTRFESAATELIAQAQLRVEIDMAANIQVQLLPRKFPQIEGLDIYGLSCPAMQVGGDFYDFSSFKNRPFVFAVGDVSGKGLSAALFMAMTRTILHTAARFMPTIDPSSILVRVNEDLYDDFSEVGMFATAFVGCYDIPSKQLTYTNAGHSPVIYCPVNGPTVFLGADSPPLGSLYTIPCKNHTLSLHANDVLIIGTDGLNESFNDAGEMFGYERLLQAVKDFSHLSSSEIVIELFNTITQFTGGYTQSDDQTLIVIKGVEKSCG